ncbi:MAG: glutaredoxin domain-containing protein [Thermodesulfobacteriota bacterium]|jgi:glutaredoxin-like YruB-family protein
MLDEIQNQQHLSHLTQNYPDFMMILFYTDSSEKSKQALIVLDSFHAKHPDIGLYGVNASRVKDIHPLYGIDSVPTLLTLRKGQPAEYVFGIQNEDDCNRLLSGTKYVPKRESKGQRLKVMVYTSDSCPWCSKAKSYLRKNSVPFNEVNVSRNSSAAQDIFRRSGQMGTPQIDINGNIVVGFDQPKIDRFLGIKG